jgi:hypothetical protein
MNKFILVSTWNGLLVKGLEPEVLYHGFYFNPCNAKRYDVGTFQHRPAFKTV